MTNTYDVIILGAGPAGYTAGIYLARFLFKTLLLDLLVSTPEILEKGASRSSSPGSYRNIPGFPGGIQRNDLKWRGMQQAQEEGCDYRIDRAIAITKEAENGFFLIHGEGETYRTRNIFFATGVEDDWKSLPGLERLAGHHLFWSVELNGKEAQGKSAAVLGCDDMTVQEALRLKLFTEQVCLLTHEKEIRCSDGARMKELLAQFNIPVFEKRIKSIICEGEGLEKLVLEDGQEVHANILFTPSQFQRPRNELALNLGVEVDARGYLKVDKHFETNIPNIYAIGDIATAASHKSVLCSYYQGMEAAWNLHNKKFNSLLREAVQSTSWGETEA